MKYDIDSLINAASEQELQHILNMMELEILSEVVANEISKHAGTELSQEDIDYIIQSVFEDYREKTAASVETHEKFSLNEWLYFWFGDLAYGEETDKLEEKAVRTKRPSELKSTGLFFKESESYIKQLKDYVDNFKQMKIENPEKQKNEIINDIKAFNSLYKDYANPEKVNADPNIGVKIREEAQKFIDKYAPHWGVRKETVGYEADPDTGEMKPKYNYMLASKNPTKPAGEDNVLKVNKFNIKGFENFSSKSKEVIDNIEKSSSTDRREALQMIIDYIARNVQTLTEEISSTKPYDTGSLREWYSLPKHAQSGQEEQEMYINPDQFKGDGDTRTLKQIQEDKAKDEKSDINLARKVVKVPTKETPKYPPEAFSDAGKGQKSLPQEPGKAKPTTGKYGLIVGLETIIWDTENMCNLYSQSMNTDMKNKELYSERLKEYTQEYKNLQKKNNALYSEIKPLFEKRYEFDKYIEAQDPAVVALAERIVSGEEIPQEEHSNIPSGTFDAIINSIKNRNAIQTQLYDEKSGKYKETEYQERKSIMEDRKSSIDEIWKYLSDDDHWMTWKYYKAKLPEFQKLLESAKERLGYYTLILDAIGTDDVSKIPDEAVTGLLTTFNKILPKRAMDVPSRVEGDTFSTEPAKDVAEAVPAEQAQQAEEAGKPRPMSIDEVADIQYDIAAGLGDYVKNNKQTQEQFKELFSFMDKKYKDIEARYETCIKDINSALLEIQKDTALPETASKKEFGNVLGRYKYTYEQAEKFREKYLKNSIKNIETSDDIKAIFSKHNKNKYVESAIKAASATAPMLMNYMQRVLMNSDIEAALRKNGITIKVINDALYDILHFGKESENNPYGVSNIENLSNFLGKIPKEELESVQIKSGNQNIDVTSIKDFRIFLNRCASDIKDISSKKLSDLKKYSEYANSAVKIATESNIVDQTELKGMLKLGENSEGIFDVLQRDEFKPYKEHFEKDFIKNSSVIKKAIRREIAAPIRELAKVIKNAKADAVSKANEVVRSVQSIQPFDLSKLYSVSELAPDDKQYSQYKKMRDAERKTPSETGKLFAVKSARNGDVISVHDTDGAAQQRLNVMKEYASSMDSMLDRITELKFNTIPAAEANISAELQEINHLDMQLEDTSLSEEDRSAIQAKREESSNNLEMYKKRKENFEEQYKTLSKKRSDIQLSEKEMRETEIYRCAKNTLMPQTAETTAYIGDLRKFTYSDYEDTRSAIDVLSGIRQTRTISKSPGSLAAEERNWYSTTSVWKTLLNQCVASITGAANNAEHEYASAVSAPSPAYKDLGKSPVRNEIEFIEKEIRDLEKISKGKTPTEQSEIKKEIDSKTEYLSKLMNILDKIPKKPDKYAWALKNGIQQSISQNKNNIKNLNREIGKLNGKEPSDKKEIAEINNSINTKQVEIDRLSGVNKEFSNELRNVSYLIKKLDKGYTLNSKERELLKDYVLTSDEEQLVGKLRKDWGGNELVENKKQREEYKRTLLKKTSFIESELFKTKNKIVEYDTKIKTLDSTKGHDRNKIKYLEIEKYKVAVKKSNLNEELKYYNKYVFMLQYVPNIYDEDIKEIKAVVSELQKEESRRWETERKKDFRK